MLNALSVDVEDYFHVTAFEQCVGRDQWDRYPLRVEKNTLRILEMLEGFGIRATFFVLGWVAARKPQLVREIQRRGHEIGCHGYDHQLIYRIGPERFREDVRSAKQCLEGITGAPVAGYRGPSYSVTKESLWALEILVEEGFTYDSTIFPIHHDIYGIPGAHRFPHRIPTPAGSIMEFPLSTLSLQCGGCEWKLPVAGGGYLRLLPASFIRRALQAINSREREPVIVYFHPWEIDPLQPRIRAALKSRLRHYTNLDKMEDKIRHLLQHFDFAPVHEVLKANCAHA